MRILLTGATGFLGSELYERLKAAGHVVYGLSRHGPDLVGDITEWNFSLKVIPHVDAVVHSAAMLSFSQHHRDALFGVNAMGTLNVCRFCKLHHIDRLVHVSTAYICGNHAGEWSEHDFDLWQRFRNPYEGSKFQAELMVRSFPEICSLIVRPSIIIGRSTDGKASTFEGFYAPLRALAKVMNLAENKLKLPPREKVEEALHLPKLRIPLTVWGNPDSTLNLVPVDWVAGEVVRLFEENKVGTYHLTSPQPLTNQEIVSYVCELLGLEGITLGQANGKFHPLDKIYNRMVRDFLPYLQHEPRFNSSTDQSLLLTGDPKSFILKAIRYWREVDHGELEGAALRYSPNRTE